MIDPDRISQRDRIHYFGILFDDNNRKPICRLHFNTSQKYIGLFDNNKKEEKIAIDCLKDIYKYSERLKNTVKQYE